MKTKTKSPALCCALLVTAASFCTALYGATSSSGSTASENAATTPTVESRPANADLKLSRGDRNFFEKAAQSGMKEVTVSQTALLNLTNPQVKSFAQMMVSDHSGANSELMALASAKGVMLPSVEKKDMKLEQKWSKKGDDLDEDYIEEMVSDHKEAVDLFEKASKSNDPEIAAFAQKTLPKLQHHLKMAQDLEKTID